MIRLVALSAPAFRLDVNALPTRSLPVRFLGPCLLAVGAVVGLVDLRPTPSEAPPRVVAQAAGEGALRAGAGRSAIELPPDAPLAGYRFFGRRAEEGAAPVHVRSLLLEAGGVRTAVVLVELMTMPPTLAAAIEERARAEGAACTMVVASHTHSGPGGYDPAFLPQLAIGRYDPEVDDAILRAVASSLAAARAELAPAVLAAGESSVPQLASNRDRRSEPTDDRLTAFVLSRPDGSRVATLARVSAHPTINPKRIGPSGDWPGFAMERLEREGGVGFVVQGAAGDARPKRSAAPGRGAVRTLLFGEAVAAAVREVPLQPVADPVALGCAEVAFDLPAADVRGMVPAGLGTLVSNLAVAAAPDTAQAIAFRLGDLALVGVPAEPMARFAPELEAAAARAGLQGRVVGLAQGYVSYGIGGEELQAHSVSAHNAWFGADLAPRLAGAAEVATQALLAEPRAASR